jgi:NAD(P)-dependent dehydrogenase (short-subunit alcohol dehydrogenase family)
LPLLLCGAGSLRKLKVRVGWRRISMRAAVFGAGGAIGAALVSRLAADERYDVVYAFSRQPLPAQATTVTSQMMDISDPSSIVAATRVIEGPLDLAVIATGMLHEAGRGPEKALRELDPDRLSRSFAINAIGPALVMQRVVPLMRRDRRAIVAALSARVGSISDNRLGGWYGYRASKAALNMMIRCVAIEIARSRPEVICVGLHPGTVDSPLSRPFQANVPAEALFTPDHAAGRLLKVLDGLGPADSGYLYAWDGTRIDP